MFSDYLGAGLVVSAPRAAGPDDEFGLAVASAGAGAPYRAASGELGVSTRARETAWELTYRTNLGERAAIQPVVQYIVAPSARADLDNALVLGVRIEIRY